MKGVTELKEILINYKGKIENRAYGIYVGQEDVEKLLNKNLPDGDFYGTLSLKVTIEEEELKVTVDGEELKEEENA